MNSQGNVDDCLIARFFFTIEVTLQLGVYISFSKHVY